MLETSAQTFIGGGAKAPTCVFRTGASILERSRGAESRNSVRLL